MSDICVDSSFLIALYDETDGFHEYARTYFLRYFSHDGNRLVIPWPIVYETLSTKMVKNKEGLARLEQDWKRLLALRQFELLPDSPFREGVVDECFDELRRLPPHYRKLSAVDRVLRKILAHAKVGITVFITFNPKDFEDVCKDHRRKMLSQREF